MGKKLILFDVDGVLIDSHAVPFDYWQSVIRKHFGLQVSRDDIYMEGKTDMQILKELLLLKGIKDPYSDERFYAALKDIGDTVRNELTDRKITPIPHVEELLRHILDQGHVIGVLTGNSREKARVKLERSGLDKYFNIGAYGDVSERRSDLVPLALEDAEKKTGIRFQPQDVFIVGDTVRDVRCAKEAGVKSVAVATGLEPLEMLKAEKPDYAFPDFTDIDEILEAFKDP